MYAPAPGYPFSKLQRSQIARAPVPAKVCVVFGTRPEAIKLGPVIVELKAARKLTTVIVNSSQHTTLLRPFLKNPGFEVDYNLDVMTHDQNPNMVLALVMKGMDKVLRAEMPDLVLVQGDTTTALGGALAAFFSSIPVAHVEAGLRSFDMSSPFPEEMNRSLISRISTYHFAATKFNEQTLVGEGIPPERIFVTGNPVVDALLSISSHAEVNESLAAILESTSAYRRITLTTHRRESFGATMLENLKVVYRFVTETPDVALIFPAHPNPNVRAASDQILLKHPRIHVIEPLAYDQFIKLLQESWLIVSDSGGIQEEAPTLGRPLLVLRENTERPEALDCGIAKLVGGSPAKLAEMLQEAYLHGSWAEKVSGIQNPFGDGSSGARIANILNSILVPGQILEACGAF